MASFKDFFKRAWDFLWHDDSFLSWLANIVLAFVIIKFVLYPLLGLLLGTPLPVVAVVSESMDHGFVKNSCQPFYKLCSEVSPVPKDVNGFDDYWSFCGSWYEKNNISEDSFQSFPFINGFSKGDIMLLVGKDPSEIKVGDVVVFQSGKPYPIIHRVIGKSDSFLMTKGDHNPSQIVDSQLDETRVPYSAVLGVAKVRLPWLGWIKIAPYELFFRPSCG